MRLSTMDKMAETAIGRLNDKRDVVILITGYAGTGKTAFSVELSRRVDAAYAIRRNMIFDPNPENIKKKVTHELPHGAAVNLDEMIRSGFRRMWASPINIFLNQYFTMCRKDYKLITMCMLSPFQLDAGIMNDRVLWWVHIIKRGYAVVMMRDPLPSKDPWGLENNQLRKIAAEKFYDKKRIEFSTEDLITIFESTDSYAFTVRFDKMPPALENEYESYADEARKELDVPEESETDKTRLYKMIMGKMMAELFEVHHIPQNEISERFGLSTAFVNRALKAERCRPLDGKLAEIGSS